MISLAANLLGLPLTPAYSEAVGSQVFHGVNYASAAAGILDVTGGNFVSSITLSKTHTILYMFDFGSLKDLYPMICLNVAGWQDTIQPANTKFRINIESNRHGIRCDRSRCQFDQTKHHLHWIWKQRLLEQLHDAELQHEKSIQCWAIRRLVDATIHSPTHRE